MFVREPRPLVGPPSGHLRRIRLGLADGARTTLYVAGYHAARHTLRVVRLHRPRPLEHWCADRGVTEALVGGFFVPSARHRPPLGELRTRGIPREHVPFDAPWATERACLHVHGGGTRIARRPEIEALPPGDLLQAGPLLVRGGVVVYEDGVDREGFSAGAHQFDSDITAGRHPRAAVGIAGERMLAVACDGRADDDAGLTLQELAEALLALGASDALNLDGGGSTSLVCAGRLRNRPRAAHDVPILGGRAVTTALVFAPRT